MISRLCIKDCDLLLIRKMRLWICTVLVIESFNSSSQSFVVLKASRISAEFKKKIDMFLACKHINFIKYKISTYSVNFMILLVFTWTWKLSYFDFKETAILERSGIREIKVQRCGIGGTSSHINIYWKTINIKLHVTYISIVIDFPTINRWIFLTIFYSLNFTVLAIVPAANFWKSRICRRLKSLKK